MFFFGFPKCELPEIFAFALAKTLEAKAIMSERILHGIIDGVRNDAA